MGFLRLYGRVFAQLGRDRRIACALVVANLILSGLQFLDPVLFGRVVGLLAASDRMRLPALWAQARILLTIWAVAGVASIVTNVLSVVTAERMAHRNRLKALKGYFAHVLSLPLSYHGDTQSGRLIKVMVTGADALWAFWMLFFRDQLATLLSVVVLLPLTIFLNWRLAMTLLVLAGLFCLLATLVINKAEGGQRRAEKYQGNLAALAQDALSNVVAVQSFNRLGAETTLFSDIVQQVIRHQFPVLNWWAGVNVLTRAASTLAVICIVIIGTWLHVHGQASVAQIVMFMGFGNLLIGRLESAMNFVSNLFFRRPIIEEFFSVLDTVSTVKEKPDAIGMTGARGHVAFEHVSFAYPQTAQTLTDLSFEAHPGMSVALVGQTGAGKSTAMNLLQRLWDPDAGRITIDGCDLRDMTLDSLRGAIGVVFQESLLFNRTIADNLRVGCAEATDEQLEYACRLADAHDFIMRQPHGYATMIGERGTSLSGGQRQRLAIARALLKNPPILVLDEATSALDAATEAKVSRAMATLMQGRTTFIIAHRLSTVRHADCILVFHGGQIVERGSFSDLLQKGGRFSELVSTQLTQDS